MTAENFIQSFHSHRMGDKGFCRLATISNQHVMYDLGFWFEIEKRNEDAMIMTAQSDSGTWKPYRQTFFINGVSQLETLIDKLRQRSQDDLHKFLRQPERYRKQ